MSLNIDFEKMPEHFDEEFFQEFFRYHYEKVGHDPLSLDEFQTAFDEWLEMKKQEREKN